MAFFPFIVRLCTRRICERHNLFDAHHRAESGVNGQERDAGMWSIVFGRKVTHSDVHLKGVREIVAGLLSRNRHRDWNGDPSADQLCDARLWGVILGTRLRPVWDIRASAVNAAAPALQP